MTTNAEVIVTKTKSKKKIKKELQQKLESALADYKGLLSEKKFKRAIAKAGKQLADRFAKHKPISKKTLKAITPKTKKVKAAKSTKLAADA